MVKAGELSRIQTTNKGDWPERASFYQHHVQITLLSDTAVLSTKFVKIILTERTLTFTHS